MDKEVLDKYVEAGKIASEVREAVRNMVSPGKSYTEIVVEIESLIKQRGGEPAFPVNISVNEIAAHFTPTKGDSLIVKDNDMVKIDLGAHIDGYVADTAVTINLNDKMDHMDEAAKAALSEALKHVYPGAKISGISESIEKTISEFGLKPVSNLTGHGINRYDLHTDPTIPNVSFTGDQKLKENEVIAIEPFATNGAGFIKDSEQVFIYSIYGSRPVRNQDSRKIIDYAASLNGLPFAERWLPIDSLFRIRLALRELRERGILHDYNVLREAGSGLVSQAEHTVIVKEKPLVITE